MVCPPIEEVGEGIVIFLLTEVSYLCNKPLLSGDQVIHTHNLAEVYLARTWKNNSLITAHLSWWVHSAHNLTIELMQVNSNYHSFIPETDSVSQYYSHTCSSAT